MLLDNICADIFHNVFHTVTSAGRQDRAIEQKLVGAIDGIARDKISSELWERPKPLMLAALPMPGGDRLVRADEVQGREWHVGRCGVTARVQKNPRRGLG